MKSTLEFNLPEEREEHRDALNGTSYKIEIADFAEYLRRCTKYESLEDFSNLKVKQDAILNVLEVVRKVLYNFCEKSLGEE